MMMKEISGQGYYDGDGQVYVKFMDTEKIFEDYPSAIAFYNKLNCDKSMWQENPFEVVHVHVVV